MDHDLKHESEEKNRAEDAKASHEVATIRRIYRLEALEKLREDVTSIIEHFMEDGFPVLDRFMEEFLESDGDTTESDGDTRESEFSESEPEMLPDQTFPEEQPVTSSVYPAREVVTLSEGKQTVAPEGKPSASEEREQESDPEIRPQMPQDRKRTVSHDRQGLRREQGTQTESAEDAPVRGLLRIPLRRTLRALGRRLQQAGEE